MKRFFALFLVLVLVIGLVACGGKKPDTTDPTTGKDPTNGTTAPTVNEKPFKGKKLQLYGFGSETSYSKFGDEEGAMAGEGNYLWMQRAAILEWAAINEVTIEFKGSFNQNVLLAAMASGDKPDMFSVSNQFPALANYGLAAQFTDAEYNELAKHMKHTKWMDMMKYNGKVSGIILPWTGFFMCYVNVDLCERYGIDSPVDYFMADQWNWENMKKFFNEVTKDTDGDGKPNSQAVSNDFFVQGIIPETTYKENGELTDEIFDKSYAYDYAEFRYNAQYQNGQVKSGAQSAAIMAGNPLVAMRLTDCEPYNFKHIFSTLSNGDNTIAIPIPTYEGKDAFQFAKVTQSAMYMASSCDEREATISLISYLLECGDKYISMLSGGTVSSSFAGVTGATELSKKWVDQFTKACTEDREAAKAELDHFDAAIMTKLNQRLDDPKTEWKGWSANQCVDVKDFCRVCTFSDPPATAMSAGREKYKTAIEKYNSLYVPKG